MTGTMTTTTIFAVFLLPARALLLARARRRSAPSDPLVALDGALTLLVECGTHVLVLVFMLRSRGGWI